MGIGAISEAIGRSPDTLRRWEREGLIAPQRDRRGRRVYSVEDLDRCRQLARMAPHAQRRSIKLAAYAGNEPAQLSLFGGAER